MGLKTVLYIPYKDFKEKLKLTRKYKKEGYYVEDWGDGIYCFKIDGYKRKEKKEAGEDERKRKESIKSKKEP